MKTINTLLLTLVMTSAMLIPSTSHAESPSGKINHILNRIMHYPEFAKKSNSSGIVYVSFETSKDGSIEVLELNASSEKFGEYVTNKLEGLNLEETEPNHIYNYKFTFKPEK